MAKLVPTEKVSDRIDILNRVAIYYKKGASSNTFHWKEKFRAPFSREVKTLKTLKETVRSVTFYVFSIFELTRPLHLSCPLTWTYLPWMNRCCEKYWASKLVYTKTSIFEPYWFFWPLPESLRELEKSVAVRIEFTAVKSEGIKSIIPVICRSLWQCHLSPLGVFCSTRYGPWLHTIFCFHPGGKGNWTSSSFSALPAHVDRTTGWHETRHCIGGLEESLDW